MATKKNQPAIKPFKSYEGLTLEGIAAQIVHSVLVWKTHELSTRNDCQLVVNNLIRSYHARLAARSKDPLPSSKKAITERKRGNKPIVEHAIPVACIMKHLLEKTVKGDFVDGPALIPKVMKVLDATALRAWVTKSEHNALRNLGLECCMPEGHKHPWPDRWARYRIAKIELAS
ncbi:hypothetical protein [Massilia sp. BKSP1R2A-1]|uniref:hypothetical protein n=1 Tax=Massilia sp. BKSP1R2A-1 TaxID=3422595 RepID=UPI003D355D01